VQANRMGSAGTTVADLASDGGAGNRTRARPGGLFRTKSRPPMKTIITASVEAGVATGGPKA